MSVNQIVRLDERDASLKLIGHVSYLLHLIVAVGAVMPGAQASVALLIVAFVVDLVKRDDAIGSWQQSHFDWRIRSVLWAAGLYLLTAPLWLLLLVPGVDRLGRDLDLVSLPRGARLDEAERQRGDAGLR